MVHLTAVSLIVLMNYTADCGDKLIVLLMRQILNNLNDPEETDVSFKP